MVDSDLLKEALAALGDEAIVLNVAESNVVFDQFEKLVPLYRGGSRIDWDKVAKKKFIASYTDIISDLHALMGRDCDERIFILWNNADFPVIQSTLSAVVKHFDDVVAVFFETWLYNPDKGYVVEYYYLGDIAVGLFERPCT